MPNLQGGLINSNQTNHPIPVAIIQGFPHPPAPASAPAPHPIEFRLATVRGYWVPVRVRRGVRGYRLPMSARCCKREPISAYALLNISWKIRRRTQDSGLRILATARTPTPSGAPLFRGKGATLNAHILYLHTFAWPHFFSSIISNCEQIFLPSPSGIVFPHTHTHTLARKKDYLFITKFSSFDARLCGAWKGGNQRWKGLAGPPLKRTPQMSNYSNDDSNPRAPSTATLPPLYDMQKAEKKRRIKNRMKYAHRTHRTHTGHRRYWNTERVALILCALLFFLPCGNLAALTHTHAHTHAHGVVGNGPHVLAPAGCRSSSSSSSFVVGMSRFVIWDRERLQIFHFIQKTRKARH